MTFLSNPTARPSWDSPLGSKLTELVPSCFSPRSCRENTQLHVSPGHCKHSDGAALHGPPAGVHCLWGVCTVCTPTSACPPGGWVGDLCMLCCCNILQGVGWEREADSS